MMPDVKICGLKTPEAVDAALEGGASHVGFIFFPKSPRNIAPSDAAALRARAAGRARAVAVSVDADDELLGQIVETMRPDMLQLHGEEPPQRVSDLKRRFGLPVIKAFAVRDLDDLKAADPYRGIADLFLFDAKPPHGSELPGGNGLAFDWQVLQALDRDTRYMLSGGLNALNVGDAVSRIRPPAIDVSSGVESAPGVKEPELIEAFFAVVRRAGEPASATGA